MSYIGNTPTQQSFTPALDYFNGTGSQTVFTLSRSVASSAQVLVFIENVPQNPSTAFTISNSTITFTSAPPIGTNNIWVEYTSVNSLLIAPSNSTVGISQLSAAGSPTSSTYLRGDNTWAAVTSLPGVLGQIFSTSGTFTIPSGVSAIKVTVCGAQGGGGGRNTTGSNKGGQGAVGGTSVKYLTGLTPGNTLTATIGAGGAGGGNTSGSSGQTGATGATGGTTSLASGTQTISTLSATGGSGGGGGAYSYDNCSGITNDNSGGVGTSGIGSGGDINARQYGNYSSVTGLATAGVGASGGTAAQTGSAGLIILEW